MTAPMLRKLDDLRTLLNWESGTGSVVSCYAPLTGADGLRPAWEEALHGRAEPLRRATHGDAEAAEELGANIAALRREMAPLRDAGARWAAAFSSVRRGFARAFAVEVPVEAEVEAGLAPYLVPALAAIHRRREYLAIHADTHRARLFAVTPAGAEAVAEFDEEVPPHQHSSGERYGYEQATIARRREGRIADVRKEVVQAAERIWDAGRYSGLILLGEHEVRAHLRDALPRRLSERVLRESAEPWHAGEAAAAEAVRSLAVEVFAQDEAAVAPGFWDRLREGAVVGGAAAAWDAVCTARVGPAGHGYLAFGPDPRREAGWCHSCGTLDAEGLGECPRCRARTAQANLWELLLTATLRHNIVARIVHDPDALKRYGGVVAVVDDGRRA